MLLLLAGVGIVALASGDAPPKTSKSWSSENRKVYSRTGPYLWLAKTPPFESRPEVRMDARGIPLNQYAGGWFYNPVSVSQYGLRHYGRWLKGRQRADRARALRAGEWLVTNQNRDGRWLYRFTYTVGKMGFYPGVTLVAPWSSAMAQGQGMSLLVRTWRLTRDRDHLRAARRAVRPLAVPVQRGGLQRSLAGGPFFEEYPTTPPSYVLNGFMFTVIGLWDLSPWSREAAELYEGGRGTLIRALPLYDQGQNRLSAYHLGFRTAGQPVHGSPGYHWVHREQLRALNAIDAHPRLADFVKRWREPAPESAPFGPIAQR